MKQLIITDATFKKEVVESTTLTLVDFWAEWCGPCRMLAPILDELASTYEGEVKFTKLNVDENPETARAFGIRSIPTVLFYRDGKVVDQAIGLLPKKELERRIGTLLEGITEPPDS